MSLLCPECLGPLATQRSTAKCTLHGGFYRILFARPSLIAETAQAALHAPPVPAPSVPPPAPAAVAPPVAVPVSTPQPAPHPPAVEETCRRHPDKITRLHCARCRAPVCGTCAFLQADGTALCPDCGRGRPLGLATAPAAALGVSCSEHPELPAVARCAHCSRPICQTCDFAFPPDLHYCPTCAVESTGAVSWRRKRSVIAAYVIALWCTVGFPISMVVAAMVGGGHGAGAALAGLLSIVSLVLAVTGTAVGFGAVDRRAGTPWWIWVAVVWNSFVLGGFLLLMVVGSLAK